MARKTVTIQDVLDHGNFSSLCDLKHWNHYFCEGLSTADEITLTETEWKAVFPSSSWEEVSK